MHRHKIINSLSNGRYKSYLEIGVDWGETLNKVEILRKVGVDPDFKVPLEKLHGECHAMTSDTYFGVFEEKFDCIFIDGMHTYQQSKRDFINAMERLNDDGIILINDCIPRDELSATPDVNECLRLRKETGQENDFTWMGDVYKTIIWINDYTDYSYALIKESVGIVAVWKTKRNKINKITNTEKEIDTAGLAVVEKIKKNAQSLKHLKKSLYGSDNILSKIFRRLIG